MTPSQIAHARLHHQRIGTRPLERAEDVVRDLVAVQAQDYPGAKWALGLRMREATDAVVEQAVAEGAILRTHVLRPTWHFVTPDDIVWLLTLTAPRVHRLNAPQYRSTGLDERTLKRAQVVIARALEPGVPLTRDELADAMRARGIEAEGLRLACLVMAAELDGVICSGPRRGKSFTYALLAARAPHARRLGRDEALTALARRYFTTRGPATVHDLAKWSGLTVTDVRRGLEGARADLEHARIGEVDFYLSPGGGVRAGTSRDAHLLSIYDEYVSSYKDRSAIVDAGHDTRLKALGNDLTSIVVLDGRIVGTWKRDIGTRALTVRVTPLVTLNTAGTTAVERAAKRYGAFLGLPARVEWA